MALTSIEDYKNKLAELNAILGADFDPKEYETLGGKEETLIGLLKFKKQVSVASPNVIPLKDPKKGYKWGSDGANFRNHTGVIISKNAIADLWNGKAVDTESLDSSVEMVFLLNDKKAQEELFKWCVRQGVLDGPPLKEDVEAAAKAAAE